MYYEKLVLLCKENGIKETNFGPLIEQSHNLVNSYSKGKKPGQDILVKTANYFDVSIDWLLDRTENRYAHKS